MAYNPNNPNGSATSANSAPVVIASDQAAVAVTGTITAVTAITNALPAGTNILGAVTPKPVTSGGLSFKKVLSANNTTSVAVKASAGQLYSIVATNTNAAARFLKLYNVAQGSVTVGTTTPDMTFAIPGNTAGAGFVLDTGGIGIAFGTAITYGITTGVADGDTGAPAANEVVATILYF